MVHRIDTRLEESLLMFPETMTLIFKNCSVGREPRIHRLKFRQHFLLAKLRSLKHLIDLVIPKFTNMNW